MNLTDKDHKRNLRGIALYGGILFIILVVGFYYSDLNKKEDRLLKSNGESTIGKVVSIRTSTRSVYVRYEYFVNGKEYKDVENTKNRRVKVGEEYYIEYLPNNPTINRIRLDKKYIE
ncbi:MAG: DUF3592 domain-containing protein [Bacteroidales bacterium]|jgi:predicted secreted protein|nr:DUF3592 domain-containing protein [Bacteroidales bacterium]